MARCDYFIEGDMSYAAYGCFWGVVVHDNGVKGDDSRIWGFPDAKVT